jgi:hypothetical protein
VRSGPRKHSFKLPLHGTLGDVASHRHWLVDKLLTTKTSSACDGGMGDLVSLTVCAYLPVPRYHPLGRLLTILGFAGTQ